MRGHKIREANRIMSCFDDYMQFRDEVDAAKKRLKGKEPTEKAVAWQTCQETERRLPGTDCEAEELESI